MPIRRLLLLGATFLASACAGGMQTTAVTPAEMDELAREVERFPHDADVLTQVGIRYYQAEAFTRARDVLTVALGLRPSFTTAVYLGLAFEGRGQFEEAETSYRVAGTLSLSTEQRQELDRRLAGLTRSRLVAEARSAIAREQELTNTPPAPNTVAVLPWSYVGANRRNQALGTGVAHLLLTDLGKLSQVTLIERERVSAILSELDLVGEGAINPSTAARSGRLMRAGWVVAGIIREMGNGVRLEASVHDTRDGNVLARATGTHSIDRLFDAEKEVVLDLLDQLGLQVSPAERQALTERSTTDLQAFLAFSNGLAAQDRGDWGTAGGLFALAAGRDPAFGAARRLGEVNSLLLTSSRGSPDALVRLANPASQASSDARSLSLLTALHVIAPSTGGDLDMRARTPVDNPRLPEALGQDNPSRIAIIGDIIIVIPRP